MFAQARTYDISSWHFGHSLKRVINNNNNNEDLESRFIEDFKISWIQHFIKKT